MSKIAKNMFLVNRYEALKKLENFFSQVDPKIMHNATFTEYMSNRFLHITEDTVITVLLDFPSKCLIHTDKTEPAWKRLNVHNFYTS